jgi:drug/metabolite transporter (DMT)-like permease
MLGILEPIIFYMFHAYGLKYTSAIRATIILSITPIIIALLSSPNLKEKLTSMKLVTIVGSMTGVYMVVASKEPNQAGDTYLLGDLLIFLQPSAMRFTQFLPTNFPFKYSFFTITRFQSIIGVIGFFPLAVGEA